MTPNFSGTWTANLSRCKFLGPCPRSLTVVIEHVGDDLQEKILLTRSDGATQQSVFQCRTNGIRDATWLDGSPIRGTAQWNDQELIIETWVQLGARDLHLCDYWSLADDGQTLLMEHRDGDLTGQLTVLDRQT
jgi:hypothetical protein